MDFDSLKETNPFDRFSSSTDLDLLEAALPHVGPAGRKPLALYIKLLEMEQIYHDFDTAGVLSSCDTKNTPPDPEAMLRAMKMAGGGNSAKTIDQLLNMLQMIKTCQSVSEVLKKNPELASLLTGLSGQQKNQPTPKDLLRQAMGGDPDKNQMMSLLAELMKSSDFSL